MPNIFGGVGKLCLFHLAVDSSFERCSRSCGGCTRAENLLVHLQSSSFIRANYCPVACIASEMSSVVCRFLVQLMGILAAAEKSLGTDPHGRAMLQNVLQSVQGTLDTCQRWAMSHSVLQAPSDKVCCSHELGWQFTSPYTASCQRSCRLSAVLLQTSSYFDAVALLLM